MNGSHLQRLGEDTVFKDVVGLNMRILQFEGARGLTEVVVEEVCSPAAPHGSNIWPCLMKPISWFYSRMPVQNDVYYI